MVARHVVDVAGFQFAPISGKLGRRNLPPAEFSSVSLVRAPLRSRRRLGKPPRSKPTGSSKLEFWPARERERDEINDLSPGPRAELPAPAILAAWQSFLTFTVRRERRRWSVGRGDMRGTRARPHV